MIPSYIPVVRQRDNVDAFQKAVTRKYGGVALSAGGYLGGNPLTGIADTAYCSLFIVVYLDNAAGTVEYLFSNTGSGIRVSRTAAGNIQVVATDASLGTIVSRTTTGAPLAAAGLYHIMISFDTSGVNGIVLYVNNEPVTVAAGTHITGSIDYTVANYAIGATTGGANPTTGSFYLVWMYTQSAIDWADELIRHSVLSRDLVVRNMGKNGELLINQNAPELFVGYAHDVAGFLRTKGRLALNDFVPNATYANATERMVAEIVDFTSVKGIKRVTTASYTLVDDDHTILVDYAAGTCTLTLPGPEQNHGRIIHVVTEQNQAVQNAAIIVLPLGGGTAQQTIVAASDGQWATLQATGARWAIIAERPSAAAGSFSVTNAPVNLGSVPRRSGSFTLTDANILAASDILITLASGPYTGRGALNDEQELVGPISFVAKAAGGGGSATVRWTSEFRNFGNVNINYTIG